MGKTRADDVKDHEMSAVEREVEQLRERTQSLLGELERRMHQRLDSARGTVERVKHAVDLPAHVRRHPRAAAGIGLGVAAAIGVGIWLAVTRHRQAARPMARVRRHADAWRQILSDPQRVLLKREPLARRLLGAVLITAATVLVRTLAQRSAHRLLEPPASPTPTVNVV
jgi:ElaB/YqjD/DUF883 family membrane-anchored ribosome-binding protein